jgi:UDP-glucose 4-epimerase
MIKNHEGKVLVLGGAGFIGSHISTRFVDAGYQVTVIDGLLSKTGGHKKNLCEIIKKIEFVPKRIEQVRELDKYIRNSTLIVDCMGWTPHLLALENPIYDLQLNCLSHLYLINALKKCPQKNVIYLGSKGQYGKSLEKRVDERTWSQPSDIQGIHKLAAESYFRIFSEPLNLSVVSLRLGNCFGPRQKTKSKDIGLVGYFIAASLKGENIILYGKTRKKALIYVQDVAETVFQLAQKMTPGFNVFNYSGTEIFITDLVKKIINLTDSGKIKIESMPERIKTVDMGNTQVNEHKLKTKLGHIPTANLDTALEATINYFKENI